MLRFVFRLMGFVLLAAAFAALIVDGTRSIAARQLLPYSFEDTAAWMFPSEAGSRAAGLRSWNAAGRAAAADGRAVRAHLADHRNLGTSAALRGAPAAAEDRLFGPPLIRQWPAPFQGALPDPGRSPYMFDGSSPRVPCCSTSLLASIRRRSSAGPFRPARHRRTPRGARHAAQGPASGGGRGRLFRHGLFLGCGAAVLAARTRHRTRPRSATRAA